MDTNLPMASTANTHRSSRTMQAGPTSTEMDTLMVVLLQATSSTSNSTKARTARQEERQLRTVNLPMAAASSPVESPVNPARVIVGF